MAEEVIESLGNMKLTTEEEEVIMISEEARLPEIESCNLSLIGKFLTCKAFNERATLSTMRKVWGMQSVLQIVEVGMNLFQFKFQNEFDLNCVLKGGPWCFDNQLLMLKRWHKGMTASNVKLECASLWVQIWGAPFDMLFAKVETEVWSRLGTVDNVERRRRQDMQNFFMRVRVALPISKPLRRGGFISVSDGVHTWVTFKYERLPIFCHSCGLLGHDLRHCASHYAMKKNGGEIEYQYGDWLKVAGSRQRSPPRKEKTEEEASAWRSENLGENFFQHADQAENQGIAGSSQMVCHEK